MQSVIIIVNPLCPIDPSTLSAVVRGADPFRFAANLQLVRELILEAQHDPHFVITSVKDAEELLAVLPRIGYDGSSPCVIMVGPQAEDDMALAALVESRKPEGL